MNGVLGALEMALRSSSLQVAAKAEGSSQAQGLMPAISTTLLQVSWSVLALNCYQTQTALLVEVAKSASGSKEGGKL